MHMYVSHVLYSGRQVLRTREQSHGSDFGRTSMLRLLPYAVESSCRLSVCSSDVKLIFDKVQHGGSCM